MTSWPVITVLGAGNMGGSLLRGLLKAGCPKQKIRIADPYIEVIADWAAANELVCGSDNTSALTQAQVVILAVKPQTIASVLTDIKNMASPPQLVISMAAGVTIKTIRDGIGGSLASDGPFIVRSMPNIAASVGRAITALWSDTDLNDIAQSWVEMCWRAVGEIIWLEQEEQFHAVTALSGSGPAYFFFLIEALQKAAQKLGLTDEVANQLITATAEGAIQLLASDDTTASQWRQRVTSPAGTTERALAVLNEGQVGEQFIQAVTAAAKRSRELGGS